MKKPQIHRSFENDNQGVTWTTSDEKIADGPPDPPAAEQQHHDG